MLRFYRKSFKAGVTIVREKIIGEGGTETWKNHQFTPLDNGKVASYANEPYLLERYSTLFTEVD